MAIKEIYNILIIIMRGKRKIGVHRSALGIAQPLLTRETITWGYPGANLLRLEEPATCGIAPTQSQNSKAHGPAKYALWPR